MSGNTVKNILSVWVFVALVVLGVGLALFISKINSAPTDSQASSLAGATIELGIKARSNVSEDNQLLFNVGDIVGFTVSLPTMPTTGLHNTLVLRFQYLKANFTTTGDIFTIDETKYLAVSSTLCTPISALYSCARKDITRKDGASFVSGEKVADITLTASTVTPAAGATTLVFPAAVANFNAAMHSYISNNANVTDPLVFTLSTKATKVIKIENNCLGDYNRLKGVSGEIVDPLDLARFAGKYGTPTLLTGADQELDLDKTGASANYLDQPDLNLFATNYGLATCIKSKSTL